jgi:hypothetical protein
MHEPITIHPANNRVFLFRGRPRVFVCATEHYGAVLNRPFRFEPYLQEAARCSQTLTRLFLLFRELQTPRNPYSTCKPESADYISPFARTGPGLALDGEPKFDLSRWNEEFFERLHRFITMAGERDVAVEIVLLSNTYHESVWALNPMNPANNVNGMPDFVWPEYMTLKQETVWQWQRRYIKKVVSELNGYDNIVYEVCNEPIGGYTYQGGATTRQDVDTWQTRIMELVRSTEGKLGTRHLIAGQQAGFPDPWEQPMTESFTDLGFDIVNNHPLPNTTYRGKSYNLGPFISKRLHLQQVRDFCLATSGEAKPLSLDEDNVASCYADQEAWTIHRKRAWMALMCGCHYDYIDFSIRVGREAGTEESRAAIRTWMGFLSRFIHSLDVVSAKPMSGCVKQSPEHTLTAALVVPGREYAIYIADGREHDQAGAGEAIAGSLIVEIEPGTYGLSCFSPAAGMESPALLVDGGARTPMKLPVFEHDIVVRLRRM